MAALRESIPAAAPPSVPPRYPAFALAGFLAGFAAGAAAFWSACADAAFFIGSFPPAPSSRPLLGAVPDQPAVVSRVRPLLAGGGAYPVLAGGDGYLRSLWRLFRLGGACFSSMLCWCFLRLGLPASLLVVFVFLLVSGGDLDRFM